MLRLRKNQLQPGRREAVLSSPVYTVRKGYGFSRTEQASARLDIPINLKTAVG
jgi:hypothetical protein